MFGNDKILWGITSVAFSISGRLLFAGCVPFSLLRLKAVSLASRFGGRDAVLTTRVADSLGHSFTSLEERAALHVQRLRVWYPFSSLST